MFVALLAVDEAALLVVDEAALVVLLAALVVLEAALVVAEALPAELVELLPPHPASAVAAIAPQRTTDKTFFLI